MNDSAAFTGKWRRNARVFLARACLVLRNLGLNAADYKYGFKEKDWGLLADSI